MNLEFEDSNSIDLFEEVRAALERRDFNIDTIIEYDINIKIISKTPISKTRVKILALVTINLKYESNLKVCTKKILIRRYLYISKSRNEYISDLYIKYANLLECTPRYIDFYLILGVKKERLESQNSRTQSMQNQRIRYRR